MDREWVEEAREDERSAELGRLRRRTLAEAVAEAMHAGDRIRITCGARSWAGSAVAVSADHVELKTPNGRVVAHLSGPIALARAAATSGGTSGDRSHGSLRVRLATVELTGDHVEVVTPDAAHVGRLKVVAADHLVVSSDGGEVWVPIGRVGTVVLR